MADLEWVLANQEGFPIGLKRGVYRALARAYAAVGRDEAAREALRHSGYPSLDPDLPQITADYWKTDGEGLEQFAPDEWAAALDLLGGGTERVFVRSAEQLLDRGEPALALKLVDSGLLSHRRASGWLGCVAGRSTACGSGPSS